MEQKFYAGAIAQLVKAWHAFLRSRLQIPVASRISTFSCIKYVKNDTVNVKVSQVYIKQYKIFQKHV